MTNTRSVLAALGCVWVSGVGAPLAVSGCAANAQADGGAASGRSGASHGGTSAAGKVGTAGDAPATAGMSSGGRGSATGGRSGADAGGASGGATTTGGAAGSRTNAGNGGRASASGGSTSGGETTTGGAASAAGGVASAAGGVASATGGAASAAGGVANGASGADDAGAATHSGGATTTGCAGKHWLICEDFESTAVGSVPSGWTQHGDKAAVNDDDAHGGSHALKLGATDSSERRIYHDAALLDRAHWGRIYYKVQTPVPDAFVHSTLVSLTGNGPQNGPSEYRPIDTVKQAKDTPDVGGRHNFIYNVQITGSSEFGTETSYDYTFDADWHCAEYHIDASNQSYALYLDRTEILSFEHGAGNYDDSDIPDSFDELRVGWINYQSAPPGFTAWIDDVAFDSARIGCDD